MSRFAQMHLDSMGGKYADMAVYRKGVNRYTSEECTTRTIAFQKHAYETITGKSKDDIDERKQLVLKRVTREFWTNFVVRGEECATLKFLHSELKKEFGEITFLYTPGNVELRILEKTDPPTPVPPALHAKIINRAWQITLALVEKQMM